METKLVIKINCYSIVILVITSDQLILPVKLS